MFGNFFRDVVPHAGGLVRDVVKRGNHREYDHGDDQAIFDCRRASLAAQQAQAGQHFDKRAHIYPVSLQTVPGRRVKEAGLTKRSR